MGGSQTPEYSRAADLVCVECSVHHMVERQCDAGSPLRVRQATEYATRTVDIVMQTAHNKCSQAAALVCLACSDLMVVGQLATLYDGHMSL